MVLGNDVIEGSIALVEVASHVVVRSTLGHTLVGRAVSGKVICALGVRIDIGSVAVERERDEVSRHLACAGVTCVGTHLLSHHPG